MYSLQRALFYADFVFSANSVAPREKSRFADLMYNAHSGNPKRALLFVVSCYLKCVLVSILDQVGQVRFGQDLLGTQVMPFTDIVFRGQ